MKLSTPMYRLKRQAKLLSKESGIPLNQALDRVAKGEGFQRWSLLVRHEADKTPATQLLERLRPGDMVLLAARPGHGKTTLGLNLIAAAISAGHQSAFFTFEYTSTEVTRQFQDIGVDVLGDACEVFTSDAISADYIIEQLQTAQRGTVVVVDYLQLLDQQRHKPALSSQISALRSFADTRGVTFVMLSQIDRSFDPASKAMPDVDDIRLPNPLDLSLFTLSCFLNDGEIKFTKMG
jgi:DnaB-like helicase C terminal domain